MRFFQAANGSQIHVLQDDDTNERLHVAMEVDNLDEVYQRIVSAGCRIEVEPDYRPDGSPKLLLLSRFRRQPSGVYPAQRMELGGSLANSGGILGLNVLDEISAVSRRTENWLANTVSKARFFDA